MFSAAVPTHFAKAKWSIRNGEPIATHAGHQHFTIGQRKGLGVARGHPLYVINIDPESNRVTVGEKESLLKRELIAHQTNLLSKRLETASDLPCTAKIRYNHTPQPARVTRTAPDELRVTFDAPQSRHHAGTGRRAL